MSDKDTEMGAPTATMTLPAAPSERQKAGARLTGAAMLIGMTALQQGARMLAVMADINDLAFRRDEGKLDLTEILQDADSERAHQLLMEAAITFAEVNTWRVVVVEEAASDGGKAWVAQALETDIAAQAKPGEDLVAALAALGTQFDAHDVIRMREPNSAPVPPAPVEYERMWEAGVPIGSARLGARRRAEVRRFELNGGTP